LENREINKRLLAIYNYFGAESQHSKMYEEACELLNAYDSGISKDITEELADVFCVVMQHYLISKKLQRAVLEKIARTEERIKTGFYEVEK
jgi:NTP pyrophosphatase (non-canonical NTP hydrolase)